MLVLSPFDVFKSRADQLRRAYCRGEWSPNLAAALVGGARALGAAGFARALVGELDVVLIAGAALLATGALRLLWLFSALACALPLCLVAGGLALLAAAATRRLRARGGPISLLPNSLQAALNETRPIDAMSAIAMIVDGQHCVGILLHLITALRISDRERESFIEALPPRVKRYVLAPGLLRVLPRSIYRQIVWEDDAPPPPPRPSHPAPSAPPPPRRVERRFLDAPPPPTATREMSRAPPVRSDRSDSVRSDRSDSVRSDRSESRSDSATSVIRAVVQFNPWPNLWRIVTGRVAGTLKVQLTRRRLCSAAAASAAALALQLQRSPRSREIAADTARFGALAASATALASSTAALAALYWPCAAAGGPPGGARRRRPAAPWRRLAPLAAACGALALGASSETFRAHFERCVVGLLRGVHAQGRRA
ncbi:hypothetical protein M885DRAFT_612228 [Pelagophyceae sp. CCMP2097]|nr:hypothetical protein M885DRAFT_612228 [Pelagophyceae sp. CCMP2097]